MSLFLIIAIIVLGLAFIFIEIFLIPGMGFVGILGGAMVVGGVILTYISFGSPEGHIAFLVSAASFVVLVAIGFKRVSELKWGLKENIEGKVNVLQENLVSVGDEGKTFSDLRPNGKAIINNLRLEVYSTGEYIDKETAIIVTKVTRDRIFVKPKIA